MFLGQRYVTAVGRRYGTYIDFVETSHGSVSQNLARSVAGNRAMAFNHRVILHPDAKGAAGLQRKLAAHYAMHGNVTPFMAPALQFPGTGPSDTYLWPYPDELRLSLTAKADAGGTTFNLQKTDSTVTDEQTLYTGRIVTFAGSTKMHMVVSEDATFPDNSTTRTVTISPPLMKEVASGSYVRLNPMGRFRWAAGYAPELLFQRVDGAWKPAPLEWDEAI